MNLPQNQCAFHTLFISSIGTFFVSGSRKKMKIVIMRTNPANSKKSPNFRWQSMVRKACAITNVKAMFTATFMACPADRTSKGQISLGTSHPSGPHDQANAPTYTQIRTRTRSATPLDRDAVPAVPNLIARMTAIATWI